MDTNIENAPSLIIKNNIDYFFKLSQILTGDNNIPIILKDVYFNRLNEFYESELADLIKKFKLKVSTAKPKELENEFKIEIFDKATSSELNLFKQVILLWYTAQFNTVNTVTLPPETEEQYKLQRIYPLLNAPVKAYANHCPKEPNQKFTYGYWGNNPTK